MQYNISRTQRPNVTRAGTYVQFRILVNIAVHELMDREEVDANDESYDIYGNRYGIVCRSIVNSLSGVAAVGTGVRRASWAICRLRHEWASGPKAGRQCAGDRL